MKKTLMIAAAAAFLMSGVAATEAIAGGGALKKCMMCHKGSPGPKFTAVKAAYTEAYGVEAEAKLVAFLTDIRDNGKKATTAPTVTKYAKKIKTMRKQGRKIKKATPEAAAAAIMAM